MVGLRRDTTICVKWTDDELAFLKRAALELGIVHADGAWHRSEIVRVLALKGLATETKITKP